MSLERSETAQLSSRIFLHVGSPKTGTTFLQQVLWSQREQVTKDGVLLPLESFGDHYLATLDIRGLATRPEHPERANGIWKRFVEESLEWPGTVLVSHELFAGATAEQAADAIGAFGADAEVHVVVTARDLARQITAEWQEHVKHRSTQTLLGFIERIQEGKDHWFWQVQDFADVLRRWGATLPNVCVHLVTVPPPGTSPEVLWRRFAGLLGLTADLYDLSSSRANPSLGFEQAELLRRVNGELGDRLPLPGPYPADVKNVFAQTILAERTGTRVELPPYAREFARERSAAIVAGIADLAVDVIGDLAELIPSVDDSPDQDRAHLTRDAVLVSESIAAVAGLLDEHRARRLERDEANEALDETRRSLHHAERRVHELEGERADLAGKLSQRDHEVTVFRSRPIRQALILWSERRPWLMAVRKVYWAVVDTSRAATRHFKRDA